jgi:hypothetical protein
MILKNNHFVTLQNCMREGKIGFGDAQAIAPAKAASNADFHMAEGRSQLTLGLVTADILPCSFVRHLAK